MIPLFKVFMSESVIGPLSKTLLSGYIGQGAKVEEFEKALIPWTGLANIVTLNSGTSALYLALKMAGIGPGDAVISSPQTCVASNTPILDHYADIIWSDIDPWTGNIDPKDVERKITPKTKAVIAVHWGGYPCELDELLRITRKYGIPLIEDAAHAFGSTYHGKKIGSISPWTAFSLQAIKHLTSVDGGLLSIQSNDQYRQAKLLRWYGIDRETSRRDLRCEEDIVRAGGKLHMNDVCATIGLENLKHVGANITKHRDNAKAYDEAFEGLRHVKKLHYQKDRESSYWLYSLRVSDPDSFLDFMAAREIMVSKVHVRNDVHTAFKTFRRNLPGVDEFAREQMSIPVGWWVGEEERRIIIAAVRDWDSAR